MKAIIDRDGCIGCGMCADICAEVFEVAADGKAEAIREGEEYRAGIIEAAENCPVAVISYTD